MQHNHRNRIHNDSQRAWLSHFPVAGGFVSLQAKLTVVKLSWSYFRPAREGGVNRRPATRVAPPPSPLPPHRIRCPPTTESDAQPTPFCSLIVHTEICRLLGLNYTDHKRAVFSYCGSELSLKSGFHSCLLMGSLQRGFGYQRFCQMRHTHQINLLSSSQQL